MPTNLNRAALTLAVLVGAFAASPAQAQENSPVVVKDYDVFVDLPTAFAFIKLPTGWKFIGKLDATHLRHLPPETLTSLLPGDDSSGSAGIVSKAQPVRKQQGSQRPLS